MIMYLVKSDYYRNSDKLFKNYEDAKEYVESERIYLDYDEVEIEKDDITITMSINCFNDHGKNAKEDYEKDGYKVTIRKAYKDYYYIKELEIN